jgi:hypothetical protein
MAKIEAITTPDGTVKVKVRQAMNIHFSPRWRLSQTRSFFERVTGLT